MKSEETRRRILFEAEKQFIEKGIQTTQIKEIAESLGMNRRTVYRYFPTKDELAFEVEMVVMSQIQTYLSSRISDSDDTGYDQLSQYIDSIEIEDIRDQIRFTAEFDRYFQDDYPTKELENSFISWLDPKKDPLYHMIERGCKDGSLRDDLTVDEQFHFISQNFFALFQRLILREKHLASEYCDHIDFKKLFKEIILNGIKKVENTTR